MSQCELACVLFAIIGLPTSTYTESKGGISKRFIFDGNTGYIGNIGNIGNIVIPGGSNVNINGNNQNSGQQCMHGWIEHNGTCYWIETQGLNWDDAYDYCIKLKAKLAEIDSYDENEFLKSTARHYGSHTFWIGGTDNQHEGTWKWATSRRYVTFTDWGPNKPLYERKDNCMGLGPGHNFQWYDSACATKNYVICEM